MQRYKEMMKFPVKRAKCFDINRKLEEDCDSDVSHSAQHEEKDSETLKNTLEKTSEKDAKELENVFLEIFTNSSENLNKITKSDSASKQIKSILTKAVATKRAEKFNVNRNLGQESDSELSDFGENSTTPATAVKGNSSEIPQSNSKTINEMNSLKRDNKLLQEISSSNRNSNKKSKHGSARNQNKGLRTDRVSTKRAKKFDFNRNLNQDSDADLPDTSAEFSTEKTVAALSKENDSKILENTHATEEFNQKNIPKREMRFPRLSPSSKRNSSKTSLKRAFFKTNEVVTTDAFENTQAKVEEDLKKPAKRYLDEHSSEKEKKISSQKSTINDAKIDLLKAQETPKTYTQKEEPPTHQADEYLTKRKIIIPRQKPTKLNDAKIDVSKKLEMQAKASKPKIPPTAKAGEHSATRKRKIPCQKPITNAPKLDFLKNRENDSKQLKKEDSLTVNNADFSTLKTSNLKGNEKSNESMAIIHGVEKIQLAKECDKSGEVRITFEELLKENNDDKRIKELYVNDRFGERSSHSLFHHSSCSETEVVNGIFSNGTVTKEVEKNAENCTEHVPQNKTTQEIYRSPNFGERPSEDNMPQSAKNKKIQRRCLAQDNQGNRKIPPDFGIKITTGSDSLKVIECLCTTLIKINLQSSKEDLPSSCKPNEFLDDYLAQFVNRTKDFNNSRAGLQDRETCAEKKPTCIENNINRAVEPAKPEIYTEFKNCTVKKSELDFNIHNETSLQKEKAFKDDKESEKIENFRAGGKASFGVFSKKQNKNKNTVYCPGQKLQKIVEHIHKKRSLKDRIFKKKYSKIKIRSYYYKRSWKELNRLEFVPVLNPKLYIIKLLQARRT